MFLGTHEPRLDEKGRLILPAKYRDELSAGLVLTRGQERCVYVFPMREFERLHEQLLIPNQPFAKSFWSRLVYEQLFGRHQLDGKPGFAKRFIPLA